MGESRPMVDWDGSSVPSGAAGHPDRHRRQISIAATAVGFVGLAAIALLDAWIAPGTAASVPLDPTKDGLGQAMAGTPAWTLPSELALSLIAVGLIGLALLALDGRWIVRLVAVGTAAAVAVGGFALSQGAFVVPGREWIDGRGHTTGPSGGLLRTSTYELAPGDAGTFGFFVRNSGPLPVVLLGWAGEPIVDGRQTIDLGARMVGLGSMPGLEHADIGDRVDLDQAVVAWPQRLEPGARMLLVGVIRGGPCAMPSDRAATTALVSVRIAYRTLGWVRVDHVPLPASVLVPVSDAC